MHVKRSKHYSKKLSGCLMKVVFELDLKEIQATIDRHGERPSKGKATEARKPKRYVTSCFARIWGVSKMGD